MTQSLNTQDPRVKQTMKKRGQTELIVGAFLIISLVIAGIGANKIVSENRYVGDYNSKIVYDLKYCDTPGTTGKLVSFANIQDAYNEGYENADCNR
jgi:hypothetical protein